MKKAYVLFVTIVLISILSFVSILILQTKSIKNENIKNQFLYIQAKNHLTFLEDYIKSVNINEIDSITIDDDFFDIKANKSNNSKYINLSVKAKDYNIRVTKNIELK